MRGIGKLLTVGMALAAALPTAAAKNYVYILTGQSNSLGAVKGSPATDAMLERYRSSAKLWNGNMVRDTGVCFEKSPAWVQVAPQLPRYGNLCMGPEYGFAHMMQRHGWHSSGADKLFIIKASLDGGGNSFWLPKGAAWNSLTASVKKACAELKGDTRLQALLYLQGESDKGEEITHAPARFLNMHARLKHAAGQGLRYAVAGECATWNGRDEKDSGGNTTASLMRAMSESNKYVGWVRTRDLTKITSGDQMGVHYDGKSQITIGARYAYAIAALEKLPFSAPTRGDDPAAAADSPAAWWGGKVPGAADIATWDVSSCASPTTLEKSVTWGGIAVLDTFSAVNIIQPGKKNAVLRVGARGIALQEGSLSILCPLETSADQTWELGAGQALTCGSKSAPIALIGKKCITLSGAQGSSVTLYLRDLPEHTWRLGSPAPKVTVIVKGKSAQLAPAGEGLYKIKPEP